jgi:dolichyl-phosphate beta-glucosyltransferase
VTEIPVKWEDVDGSHLNVIDASLSMARDMFMIRVLYMMGIWAGSDVNW